MTRRYDLYLRDMLEACERVLEYAQGMDFVSFTHDKKTVDAVLHSLIIIGEAAGSIPPEIASSYPGIPWREMKNFKNLATHEYWKVDLEIIWTIVAEEIPKLKQMLAAMPGIA